MHQIGDVIEIPLQVTSISLLCPDFPKDCKVTTGRVVKKARAWRVQGVGAEARATGGLAGGQRVEGRKGAGRCPGMRREFS